METKANYLLIGVFTLLGLLASMAFLLWLAKVEVNRQFSYFDILFENVNGLGNAANVRYNGLPVGRVVDLRLDPDDPSRVRVRIEVNADTPVRTDTVATLQGQGVTGVSFVALSGGSADAEPLPPNGLITAQSSAWQSVLEGAPELLQKAVVLLEEITEVVSDENREAVSEVLGNLSSASGRLDRTLEDFETLSSDLGTAAREVARFSGRLETLADTADITLNQATDTLEGASRAFAQGESTLARASQTFTAMDDTFSAAQALMENEGADFLRQSSLAATTLDETLKALTPATRNTLDIAQSTLSEAGETFAATNKILQDDVGAIVSDVRGAATAFTDTMERASGNIDTVSTEILAASSSIANFAGTLETAVSGNSRQINSFFRLGLPEFLRLTEEARQLVRNLDRFVDRVERDPARFFLGTQGSEFRR